jgi:hypothetical protein
LHRFLIQNELPRNKFNAPALKRSHHSLFETTRVKNSLSPEGHLLGEKISTYSAKSWNLVEYSATGAAFLALSTLPSEKRQIFCCDLSDRTR